jgi:hypothetical protein
MTFCISWEHQNSYHVRRTTSVFYGGIWISGSSYEYDHKMSAINCFVLWWETSEFPLIFSKNIPLTVTETLQKGSDCVTIELSQIGLEVLTPVVMKSSIFLDITSCSPLKVNQCFGGTYCLHLRGRKISRARDQRESRWQADQYPCKKIGLYRKQQQVSSRRTD